MDQNQVRQSIMDDLGLSDLPQEKQEELLIKMTEVILKRMFVETMDKLNASDQDKYAQMIDNQATPEEVENFLKGKISNYDEMLQKIVADFKEEMKKEI